MSSIVLDCSITIAWCFEDEVTEYTESVLESLTGSQAWVPCVWPLEVANVLVLSERRGRTNQAKVTQFLEFLSDLPIIVDAETQDKALTDILSLARANKLTSYDAAYLELAMRKGDPLATLDEDLKRAASKLGAVLF